MAYLGDIVILVVILVLVLGIENPLPVRAAAVLVKRKTKR
jgi:hypothetical protein